MRNPNSITGNPADNPANTPQPQGIPNPYGLGLSAFEPNTTPYTQELAGNSDVKALAASPTSGPDPGPADSTEPGSAQAKDAQAAAKSTGYAAGGIIDAHGKVQAMISAALQLAARNVPYVWGGTSANGVDCSGLIYYAAHAAGITDWKRYVASDYGKMGTRVTAQDARPGDIVYYDEGGGAGHVGIYLGNGMMVAAPQTGQNVQVQRVYGTPTGYQRIFTDSAFGTTATPGGGQTYNYNGQSYNPAPSVTQTLYDNGFDNMNSNRLANYGRAEPGATSYGGGTLGGSLKGGIPFAATFQSAGAMYGVPPALLAAVAHQESGFNTQARSSSGAVGLMQFMPATAAGLGVNPLDANSSINGAARYLSGLYHEFGSWSLALAAYNAGPGTVRRYGGIPPYGETQRYVANVSALAQQYQ
jgi:cell wall-associated NlpC family hydrolase